MGNIFTLDSMREEIEREYSPVRVEIPEGIVTLRSLLRVPKKQRDAAFGLIDELTSEKSDGNTAKVDSTVDAVKKVLVLVADDDRLAKLLVKHIGDDVALALKLFERWMEATQPGEATRSEG